MQTQLYTSIVYQIRHSSLVINSFYLMFNRLMTSIIGLETRSFFFFYNWSCNGRWWKTEIQKNTSSSTYVGIFTGATSSFSYANYALGKQRRIKPTFPLLKSLTLFSKTFRWIRFCWNRQWCCTLLMQLLFTSLVLTCWNRQSFPD